MQKDKSRREILKGLAAVSAAATLPMTLGACSAKSPDAQVIVIGAGLAGLNAALTLQDQGMDVLVLEGSNRIGGRVYTLDDQPHKPDAGGSEFSLLSYARIVDRIEQLGLKMIPWRGKDIEFAFNVAGQTVSAADWPTAAVNVVQGPAHGVPPIYLGGMFLPRPSPLATADAWLMPEAMQYDVPFGSFMQEAGAGQEALRLIEARANADDLNEISTLWEMHKGHFTQISGGLGDLRNLEGGMSRLTDGMAALMNRPVQLNAKVTEMHTDANGTEVTIADGKVLRADYVVSTMPLTMMRNVAISPALPSVQAAAVNEIPYDEHIEVFFDVLEPFWEEDGLAASLWSDGPLGLALHLPDAGTNGFLWLVIAGKASAGLRELPDDQLLASVAEELARVRPSTVGRIRPMTVQNWSTNEWTQGHLAYRAPGQIEKFGTAAADPHGRIHFAGEHTAVTASGMEGAMESGERAAIEILTRLP